MSTDWSTCDMALSGQASRTNVLIEVLCSSEMVNDFYTSTLHFALFSEDNGAKGRPKANTRGEPLVDIDTIGLG